MNYRLYQEGDSTFVLKDDSGSPVAVGESANQVRDELLRMMAGLGLPIIDQRQVKAKKR